MEHACKICDKELITQVCLRRHFDNFIGFYPSRYICAFCNTDELGSESRYQILESRVVDPGRILEEAFVIEDGDTGYKLINDLYRLRSTVILLKKVGRAIRVFEPQYLGNFPLIEIDPTNKEKAISKLKMMIIFS